MATEKVDVTDPSNTAQKPGYKTTEFWFGIAASLLTAVFASGAVTNSTVLQVLGLVGTVLTTLGYTVTRGAVKAGANKQAAAIEIAKVSATAIAANAMAVTATAAKNAVRDVAAEAMGK